MPNSNDINRINNPIEMAIKMLESSQENIFNSILGPEPTPRKLGKINGEDVDSILDQVVRNAQLMGQQQQQAVTAPPPPVEAPVPMPAPPTPPVPPEAPSPGGQSQAHMGVSESSMDQLSRMFGGGMNNGNA